MIEPERWYEYQKNYQRYGFDMKPQPERETRAERHRKRKRKIVIPVGNGRKVAFSMVLLVGIVMIALIIVTAYSANVRYNINSVIKENQELMGEIENLQVKLYSANNVNYIEGKAVGELKMVYPEAENRVYITVDDIPESGFADMLKEKAYN